MIAVMIVNDELTAARKAILDQRLKDFRCNPHTGTPAELVKASVLRRPAPR